MTKKQGSQIKSKERVAERGEVFTNEREVKAMCDLVAQECDRIDSRFLEPACGDGNFLAEILERKLATVKKLHKRNAYDYERYSVLAVSSIYGVDIMQDNAEECRNRLYEIWDAEYRKNCKKECNDNTRNAVRYILSQNILLGNALTLMCVDEEQNDTDVPIIFPEWSLVMGTKLKRRDFRFDVLLKAKDAPKEEKQISLLNDGEDLSQYLSVHPATGEYVPKPIREFAPVDYRKMAITDVEE
ncbi:MAG: hypothetical protein IJF28_00760 [Firmicutes bacterium]|nr:hypothetical protein [Bacillota bacterium]